MPVALVKITGDSSLKQVEAGEQSNRSVPLVIVCVIVPQRPFFRGSPGWVRFRA